MTPPQENRRKDDSRIVGLEKRADATEIFLRKIDKSQTSTHKRLNELTDEIRISLEEIKGTQGESHKIIADKLEVTNRALADKLELTNKILADKLESTDKDLADKLEKADRQRAEDLLKYQAAMIGSMTKLQMFQSGLYFLVTTAWATIVSIGAWIFQHHDKIKAVKP